MTSKNVTNTTVSPLGLPNGQIIDPKSTVLVKNWEKVESNQIVQSWLAADALTLAADALTLADAAESDEGEADTSNTPPKAPSNEGGNGGPVVLFTPKTDDELAAMTNGERANYIEKELGGTVKSGSTKDELNAQIKELSDAKVAANAAASSVTQTN